MSSSEIRNFKFLGVPALRIIARKHNNLARREFTIPGVNRLKRADLVAEVRKYYEPNPKSKRKISYTSGPLGYSPLNKNKELEKNTQRAYMRFLYGN